MDNSQSDLPIKGKHIELVIYDDLVSKENVMQSKSPIFQALGRHLEAYGGLLEPRLEIADIALKNPQRDDL